MIDSEIQRRRTFEVIAKWVARENGITMEFRPDATPCADPKRKHIILPNNIKEENLDKVLALVLHEAGHIAHTWAEPKKMVKSQEEMSVLNSAEDIRIDNMMSNWLPAIHRFYDELAEWEEQHRSSNVPIEHEILCHLIREATGYSKYNKHQKAKEFVNKNNLTWKINELVNLLQWSSNEPQAKKKIDEITNIIYGNQRRTPIPQGRMGEGQGQGQAQSMPSNGSGSVSPNGTNETQGTGNKGDKQSNGKQPGGLGCGRFRELFDPDPNAKIPLNEVSLKEQIVQAFNELLTIKSRRIIKDTKKLDTDALTSFFTGDIDELFIDEKVIKNKKSKILMLLDSSGSMHSTGGLCDTKSRHHIVANVAKRIGEMIDEVIDIEGINVDYLVRAFGSSYIKLSKENWYEEYCHRSDGSTYLAEAFEKAQDEILQDPINGHKIIILITDGEIGQDQISKIKEMITKHNEDIRCLVLGVGLNQQFSDQISGRNILAESLADGVVLQAIEDLLD